MSEDNRLLTAEEWLCEPEYEGVEIYDPDGWDRSPEGWEQSWNEKINHQEFNNRLMVSTILFPKSFFELDKQG